MRGCAWWRSCITLANTVIFAASVGFQDATGNHGLDFDRQVFRGNVGFLGNRVQDNRDDITNSVICGHSSP